MDWVHPESFVHPFNPLLFDRCLLPVRKPLTLSRWEPLQTSKNLQKLLLFSTTICVSYVTGYTSTIFTNGYLQLGPLDIRPIISQERDNFLFLMVIYVLGSEVGWLNWLERCNVASSRPSSNLRSFIHYHHL